MMRRQAGFTLVELVIVVAIVAVIVAVAIPNLLEARKSANEASAISSLRTLVTSQALFRDTDPDGDGLADYATLTELETLSLIDSVLASGTKSGYLFVLTPTVNPPFAWNATADPGSPRTGTRHFFVDESGVIHWSDSAQAGAADPPLNGEGPPVPTPEQQAAEVERHQQASFTVQELDELITGSAIDAARQLVGDPANVQTILVGLDEDESQQLEMSEVLDADLLSLARSLIPALVGSDQGPAIGNDADLILVYEAYYQFLHTHLELGMWNEDPPPAIELALLNGDPEAFLAGLTLAIPGLGAFVFVLGAGLSGALFVALRRRHR